MYDNKIAIEEAKKFEQSVIIGENVSPFDALTLILEWVKHRHDYERDRGLGTAAEQLEWFQFLLSLGQETLNERSNLLGKVLFTMWGRETENPYGSIYIDGFTAGRDSVGVSKSGDAEKLFKDLVDRQNKYSTQKATNGRRLIGASSRKRVAEAAEKFNHLSKEKAAYQIADLVSLDTGTVKRYLSQIFPGNKWGTTQKPNDMSTDQSSTQGANKKNARS